MTHTYYPGKRRRAARTSPEAPQATQDVTVELAELLVSPGLARAIRKLPGRDAARLARAVGTLYELLVLRRRD